MMHSARCLHHPLESSAVQSGANPTPDGDTASEDGGSIEVHGGPGGHAKLPESPKELELFLCLNYCLDRVRSLLMYTSTN